MPYNTTATAPLAVGPAEAARLIGMGKTAFYKALDSGHIGPQGRKIGGKRLFPVCELKAWVAAGMPPRKEWLEIQKARANG